MVCRRAPDFDPLSLMLLKQLRGARNLLVFSRTGEFGQNGILLPWARTDRLQRLPSALCLLRVFFNLGNLLFG